MKKMLAILYMMSLVIFIGQGVLYKGGIVTRFASIDILLTNLICLFHSDLKKDLPILFRAALLMIIWVLFTWIIHPSEVYSSFLHEKVSTTSMFLYATMVFSSIAPFYVFGKKSYIQEKEILFLLTGFFILFVYNFYTDPLYGIEVVDFSNITNNRGYPISALFPLILVFWDKKYLLFASSLAIMFFCLISFKRGTFVVGLFCMLVLVCFSLKDARFHGYSKRKNIFLLIAISAYIAYLFITDFYESSFYLQERIEETLEGDSSSRDVLYVGILKHWYNSGFFMIIGNGLCSTVSFGNYAHNDWLEILYDMGLIGLFLYLSLLASVYKISKINRDNSVLACCSFIVLAYFCIRGSVSMAFYELESIIPFCALGYYLGSQKRSTTLKS